MFFKKFISLNISLILILLSLLLISCGGAGNNNTPQDNNSPTPAPQLPPDDQITPPITKPSPPVLYLKLEAQGDYDFENGIFSINGRVTDQDNQVVENSIVTLINLRTNESLDVLTDANGNFIAQLESEIGDTIRIQARNPANNTVSNIVELLVIGTNAGQLVSPKNMASYQNNGREFLFISELLSDRIQVFERIEEHLIYLTQFGERGNFKGQFNFISDIVVDKNGFVFVSDAYNKRIQVLKFENDNLSYVSDSLKDNRLGPWDSSPFGNLFLLVREQRVGSQPKALSISNNNKLLASDSYFQNIKILSWEEETLQHLFNYTPFYSDNFIELENMEITENSNLWITDIGNQTLKLFKIEDENFTLLAQVELESENEKIISSWKEKWLLSINDINQLRFFEFNESIQAVYEHPLDFGFENVEIIDHTVGGNILYINTLIGEDYYLFLYKLNENNNNFSAELLQSIPIVNTQTSPIKNISDISINSDNAIFLLHQNKTEIRVIEKDNESINELARWSPAENIDLAPLSSIDITNNRIFCSDPENNKILSLRWNGRSFEDARLYDFSASQLSANDNSLYTIHQNRMTIYDIDNEELILRNSIQLPAIASDITINENGLVIVSYEGFKNGTDINYFENIQFSIYQDQGNWTQFIRHFTVPFPNVEVPWKRLLHTRSPGQIKLYGNYLYIADPWWYNYVRILRVRNNGRFEFIREFGGPGYSYGQFNSTSTLAPHALDIQNDRLYVMDEFRLQIFPLSEEERKLNLEGDNELFQNFEELILANTDSDFDGVSLNSDNCPELANSNQEDHDNDGIGDACDEFDNRTEGIDSDGDGLSDTYEEFYNLNPYEEDTDSDGISDLEEIRDDSFNPHDRDHDGIIDALESYQSSHLEQTTIDGVVELIEIESQNLIFIADEGNFKIYKFRHNGKFLDEIFLGETIQDFKKDSLDQLWVLLQSGKIKKYNTEFELLDEWEKPDNTEGLVAGPYPMYTDLLIDRQNNIWLISNTNILNIKNRLGRFVVLIKFRKFDPNNGDLIDEFEIRAPRNRRERFRFLERGHIAFFPEQQLVYLNQESFIQKYHRPTQFLEDIENLEIQPHSKFDKSSENKLLIYTDNQIQTFDHRLGLINTENYPINNERLGDCEIKIIKKNDDITYLHSNCNIKSDTIIKTNFNIENHLTIYGNNNQNNLDEIICPTLCFIDANENGNIFLITKIKEDFYLKIFDETLLLIDQIYLNMTIEGFRIGLDNNLYIFHDEQVSILNQDMDLLNSIPRDELNNLPNLIAKKFNIDVQGNLHFLYQNEAGANRGNEPFFQHRVFLESSDGSYEVLTTPILNFPENFVITPEFDLVTLACQTFVELAYRTQDNGHFNCTLVTLYSNPSIEKGYYYIANQDIPHIYGQKLTHANHGQIYILTQKQGVIIVRKNLQGYIMDQFGGYGFGNQDIFIGDSSGAIQFKNEKTYVADKYRLHVFE